MALNLLRNSRVFFTTNVNSQGKVATTGFDATNTYELQVLDGFTFSQNTNADTVTISEAGVAPVRGQRSFNTSLAPVDFSMSTYLRPKNATTAITAEESVLWNALLGTTALSTTAVTVGGTISGVTYSFTNGVGTVTISGTSLTYGSLEAGNIVTIGGTNQLDINTPAVFKTGSATAITLELVNPVTGTVTVGTPATLKFYKSPWAPVAATYSVATTAYSNTNQLQTFGMVFVVDNVVYVVDNCAMAQATIDFGLDAIATAAWTGQGTALTESADITLSALDTAAADRVTNAPFITNKLSTVSMKTLNALGTATATTYGIALTGGSVTINNNITYITPANLGVVNVPAVYYTGTRSITGTMNAYLKTGTGVGSTGQLLKDMLAASSTTIEPMAALSIAIGGSGNPTKVVLDMPAVTFTIPTVDVQQVVSTAINFTSAGYNPSATANGNTFDLTKTNDLLVRYYSAT